MEDTNPQIAICLDCFTWNLLEVAVQKDNMLWQTGTSSCKHCGGKITTSRLSEVENIKNARKNGKIRD